MSVSWVQIGQLRGDIQKNNINLRVINTQVIFKAQEGSVKRGLRAGQEKSIVLKRVCRGLAKEKE